jgi:hypothetical protein
MLGGTGLPDRLDCSIASRSLSVAARVESMIRGGTSPSLMTVAMNCEKAAAASCCACATSWVGWTIEATASRASAAPALASAASMLAFISRSLSESAMTSAAVRPRRAGRARRRPVLPPRRGRSGHSGLQDKFGTGTECWRQTSRRARAGEPAQRAGSPAAPPQA